MTENSKPSVAIIGSGVSGLTAAWLLKHTYNVSLFEKAPRLGMGQNGIDYQTNLGTRRIDVPLRVFSSSYYPNLYKICKLLGVNVRLLDNDSSFSNETRETYFRYFNLSVGSLSFSYIKPRLSQLRWTMSFLKEYFRLKNYVLKNPDVDKKLSIDEFFNEKGYSKPFTNEFFYPFFAAVCTCSYEALKAFPATVILGLFQSFIAPEPMRRWTGGTSELEKALSADVEPINFEANIVSIDETEDRPCLQFDDGKKQQFDKVIIALQANQAASILGETYAKTKKLLKKIPYGKLEVAVHGDESVMPIRKKDWATVNYTLSAKAQQPQASLWLNRGESDFHDIQENLFQTVNPGRELNSVVKTTSFERSLVTVDSMDAVNELIQLQENQTNVYLCGAYLAEKLPLLENGVVSAIRISRKLGATIPQGLG